MWHWNSFWARAPGDPPTLDDPALWRGPWSPEQTLALQARLWESMLSAGHSWWSLQLSMLPVPTWPVIGQVAPPSELTAQPVVHGAEDDTPPPARSARKRSTRRTPVARKH